MRRTPRRTYLLLGQADGLQRALALFSGIELAMAVGALTGHDWSIVILEDGVSELHSMLLRNLGLEKSEAPTELGADGVTSPARPQAMVQQEPTDPWWTQTLPPMVAGEEALTDAPDVMSEDIMMLETVLGKAFPTK